MRFPAARRLRSASEFGRVRSEGTTYPGRYVVLGVLRAGEEAPWRSGLITSRKVGGAVQRNLVRRRLREILRATPLAPGVWLVVIARWKAAGATFDELRTDFQKVAKRAGVLVRENPPAQIQAQTQTRPVVREEE